MDSGKGQTLLVTGGAGFIGSHTCVELSKAGYNVVVLDSLVNSKKACIHRIEQITGKKIPFHEVDLMNIEQVRDVFKQYQFSGVLHFASLKAVGDSVKLPLLYYRNNISGFLNLFQVMQEFNVKKIIFSSSATVYGVPTVLPITEAFPVGSCTNPYGQTKFMIEEICRDVAKADPEWSIVILRYFNPVGAHESGLIGEDPSGHPNNLFPFIAQVAVGRRPSLSVFGDDFDTPDGTGVRDYIHVVDLALGHVAATRRLETNPGCEVFNLGLGKGVSVLETVKSFEKACGKTIPICIAPRRPGDIAESYADCSKARIELGWEATRGIDQCCIDSWNWQSNNPNGFPTE